MIYDEVNEEWKTHRQSRKREIVTLVSLVKIWQNDKELLGIFFNIFLLNFKKNKNKRVFMFERFIFFNIRIHKYKYKNGISRGVSSYYKV